MSSTNLDAILKKIVEIRRDVMVHQTPDVDLRYQWPEASLRALQQAGIGGLVAPQECGGHGMGLYAMTRVCEILGEECASTALCFGMHLVATAVIAAKATVDQKERYLAPIAAGTHFTTLALSESGSGAHFYFPRTELTRDPEGDYRVNGQKSFVTSGGHADSYVVSTTAADPHAPVGQFSCVLVAADAAGLSWGPPWKGLGMRGNDSRQAELKDVRISRRDMLGEEGDQMWYVFNVVGPYFLGAMAGTYIGLARAALAEASAHVSGRRYAHSGATLAASSIVQHRLGSMWAQVERSRRLLYYAAAEVDAGGVDAALAVYAAKAEAADCAVNVVNEAMTLTGGIAYRDGSRLERLLRDARAAHVMAPTTDILRTWTGRVLLGQPLLGD